MGRDAPTPLVIQKFGGSSVATLDRIKRVAAIVRDCINDGKRVVVVVSAMGGDTDRLSSLAAELGFNSGAELDVLLASAEQASAALLAMALQKMGVKAMSFCAHQVCIKTSAEQQQSRIESIESENLWSALDQAVTPIVAGFQGVNEKGEITTLGRGGSDLTAVAIAAALDAEECRIYTDIDGVYSADPRIVANAKKIESITLPLMTEYAQAGAGILQSRCLDLASKESVAVRVLSSYANTGGTRLVPESKSVLEGSSVVGIAAKSGYQLLLIPGLPSRPGILSYCFAALRKIGLSYEMAQFNLSSLTLALRGLVSEKSGLELKSFLVELGGESIYQIESDLSKITIIGSGFDADQGAFLTACSVLSKEGVDPRLLSFCSTRIEVLVPSPEAERVVCALHEHILI